MDYRKLPKIPLNFENLEKYEILTKVKAQILNHPAGTKIMVGGKNAGKTMVAGVKLLTSFETDPKYNAVGIRKFTQGASTLLSGYFMNLITVLEDMKLTTKYTYRTSNNKIYRESGGIRTNKFQKLEMTSLESPTGTDGMSITNGGYYGDVFIDEAIDKEDAEKPNLIPTERAWKEKLAIIKSNIFRYNDNYNMTHFGDEYDKYVSTTMWLATNPWAFTHPLMIYVHKYIPEDDYINWVLGVEDGHNWREWLGEKELIEEKFNDPDWVLGLMNRNTKLHYVKEDDTLISFMTQFASPKSWIPKNRDAILKDIKNSMLTVNLSMFAIAIGAAYESEVDLAMRSYNFEMNDIPRKSEEEFIRDGYEMVKLTYSWDIDQTRVNTMTPGYVWRKPVHLFPYGESYYDYKISTGKQIEIKSRGTGSKGEEIRTKADHIMAVIRREHRRVIAEWNQRPEHVLVTIDDKFKAFIPHINGALEFVHNVEIFKQQGPIYNIAARQNMTHMGFEHNILYVHPDSEPLMRDFTKTMRKELNNSDRNTLGSINYLDRIDSFENAWIRDRMIIKTLAAGEKYYD